MSTAKFNPTADELKRLEECLRDEEFCKLFASYVEEIKNPENLKEYEAYLKQLEMEGGAEGEAAANVIIPDPVFCFKVRRTTADRGKVFVNVCQSDKLDLPEEIRVPEQQGSQWRLPLSLGSGREDTDKEGNKCTVYDIIFHPQALDRAKLHKGFRNMIVDVARSHVMEKFKEPLSEKFSVLKMKCKSQPHPQSIRSKGSPQPSASGAASSSSNSTANANGGGGQMPPPAELARLMRQQEETSKQSRATAPPSQKEESLPSFQDPWEFKAEESMSEVRIPSLLPEQQPAGRSLIEEVGDEPVTETPHFEIVQRGNFDLSEHTFAKSVVQPRPRELVVRISLPKLDSAQDIDLDVGSRSLSLRSEGGEYALETSLPYEVDSDAGTALFEVAKHTLVLTLPVVRPPAPPPKPFVEPEEVLEDPAMGEQQDEEAHGMEEEAHRTEEKGTSDAVEAPSSSMSSTSTSKSTSTLPANSPIQVSFAIDPEEEVSPRPTLERVNTPHPVKTASFAPEEEGCKSVSFEEPVSSSGVGNAGLTRVNTPYPSAMGSRVTLADGVGTPARDSGPSDESTFQRVNTPHPSSMTSFVESRVSFSEPDQQAVGDVPALQRVNTPHPSKTGSVFSTASTPEEGDARVSFADLQPDSAESLPKLERLNTPHPSKSASFGTQPSVSFAEDSESQEDVPALQRVNTPHPSKSATFVAPLSVSFAEDSDLQGGSPLQRVNTPHPSKVQSFTEELSSPSSESSLSAQTAQTQSALMDTIRHDSLNAAIKLPLDTSRNSVSSSTSSSSSEAPPGAAGLKLTNKLMFELD